MNLLQDFFNYEEDSIWFSDHFISNDLLVEVLVNICQENEKLKNRSNSYFLWNCLNYQKFISIIFKICSLLEIKNESIRYQTCDLFESFIFCHIHDLNQEIESLAFDQHEKKEVWTNVQHQALLRLISCLSISTKMSSFYSLCNIDSYYKLLQRFGFKYSKKAFIKSELRVLKTINYRINQISVSSLYPLLLLAMSKNEPTIKIAKFYPTIYKVIDFFYLYKRSIFGKLFEKLKSSTCITYR